MSEARAEAASDAGADPAAPPPPPAPAASNPPAPAPATSDEFNPLRHPILFNTPQLLSMESAWVAQVPLAYLMIDLARPRVFVELGTLHGDSYCAFNQAVAELKTGTRCFAIDTWQGDERGGFYDGATVLPTLRRHHDPLYGAFSTLVKSDFDSAATRFEDGSIDLLHLDAPLTKDAVRHDFQRWLPKMSDRGVMLFHNATERHDPRFEVWRQWEVISWQYPSFDFPHGHGLGIAAVGADAPAGVLDFLRYANANAGVVRQFFAELGERIVDMQVLLRTTHWLAMQWKVLAHWRRMARQPGLAEVNAAEVFGDPEPLARALVEEVARLAQDDLDLRETPEQPTTTTATTP